MAPSRESHVFITIRNCPASTCGGCSGVASPACRQEGHVSGVCWRAWVTSIHLSIGHMSQVLQILKWLFSQGRMALPPVSVGTEASAELKLGQYTLHSDQDHSVCQGSRTHHAWQEPAPVRQPGSTQGAPGPTLQPCGTCEIASSTHALGQWPGSIIYLFIKLLPPSHRALARSLSTHT